MPGDPVPRLIWLVLCACRADAPAAPPVARPVPAEPPATFVVTVVDVQGEPVRGLDVVFGRADGSLRSVEQTDASGTAMGAVDEGAIVTLLGRGATSLYDLPSGSVITFAEPPALPPTLDVVLGSTFEGAERYTASAGCADPVGRRIGVGGVLPVRVGGPCVRDGTLDVLAWATDPDARRLAAAELADVPADAAAVSLGDWTTELDQLEVRTSGPIDSLGPSLEVATLHRGSRYPWPDPPPFADTFPLGPTGFADGAELQVEHVDGDWRARRVERWLGIPEPVELDHTVPIRAIEGRWDADSFVVDVTWLEQPPNQAVVQLEVLFGYLPSSYAWRAVGPPSRSRFVVPDLPDGLLDDEPILLSTWLFATADLTSAELVTTGPSWSGWTGVPWGLEARDAFNWSTWTHRLALVP